MFNKFSVALAALCGAFLTACGGGGGGGSSLADVTLGGTFSKGLYRGAKVQAYEVVSGNLVAIGSEKTTGDSGEYSLTLKPTSNPVVVVMTTTATTTMLNELTGNYGPTTPGTKMRTMLGELTSSMPEVHGNPLTEMAVAGAQNSPTGLTSGSIAASKALVQDLVGVDPFATKAVGDATVAMTPSQEKLMTVMSALMLDAEKNKGAVLCPDDPTTGVACVLNQLNAKAKLTTDVSGAFKFETAPNSVAGSGGLKTILNAKLTDLSTDTTTISTGSMAAKMQAKTSDVILSNAAAAISPTDALYRQGLDAFLQAMRGGFNQADTALRNRANDAKSRLDQMVFEHVGDGLKVLGDAMDACTNTNGTLTCATTGGSIFSAAAAGASGYRFDYYVDSTGTAVVQNVVNGAGGGGGNAQNIGDTYRYQGTVAATANNTAGTGNVTITAQKTLGSKTISDISISFNGTGIKQNSLSGAVTLSTMTIKAYDQALNSSKWAQVSLSGASLSGERPSVGAAGTLTLVAPLTFTTSDGDLLSGKINQLVAKEKITNSPNTGDKKAYPVSVNLSLDMAVQEGALLGLSVTGSQNIDAYDPDLPASNTNKPNGTFAVTFKLADNIAVALSGTKASTTPNETAYTVKVTSNETWINFEGKTSRASYSDREANSGDITVSSSGVYTAKLRKNNSGQVEGEIYKGTLQIGDVLNGMVRAGGREISLR